jgi:thioredoxin-like negative regulator of GroEL
LNEEHKMGIIETLTSDKLEAQAFHTTWPVALDFYQASCSPCRALEPRLERLAGQYVGRLRVYRVDTERDMTVAERFGVQSIPTVLILREGKELERLDGLITDDDLKTAFERAIRT